MFYEKFPLRGVIVKILLQHGLMLLAMILPSLVYAQNINWQEAVAQLAHERTRAETCVSLLKQYGDKASISQGKLAYSKAKANMDGVIAGLITALALDKEPKSLSDLNVLLEKGVSGRKAFCEQVTSLVPKKPGQKNAFVDLLGNVLNPLIEAATTIYMDVRKTDHLTRITIQTQLEGTKWSTFSEIANQP
jgi:hypothetical protein